LKVEGTKRRSPLNWWTVKAKTKQAVLVKTIDAPDEGLLWNEK
jgi:hypothetical protein